MVMHSDTSHPSSSDLAKRLAHSGLRLTSQREHVYQTLLEHSNHPTADEVYLRIKTDTPDISIATVYNTLDALVKCGLVKQVNVDRSATRFCSNLKEHCHFFCEECGGIHDLELTGGLQDLPVAVPDHLVAKQVDISFRGHCRQGAVCPRRAALAEQA